MIPTSSPSRFDDHYRKRLLDFVLRHDTVGSYCSERSQAAYSPNEDCLRATVTSLGKVASIAPPCTENDVCDVLHDKKQSRDAQKVASAKLATDSPHVANSPTPPLSGALVVEVIFCEPEFSAPPSTAAPSILLSRFSILSSMAA